MRGLRAFTVKQADKRGGALRSFFLAAFHHEDIRRIRSGMLWALCVAALPIWVCARWPESLGKGVVNALLGLWLVGFLCLVFVLGLERRSGVSHGYVPRRKRGPRRMAMADLVFVGVTLGFFLISIGYVFACGRL